MAMDISRAHVSKSMIGMGRIQKNQFDSMLDLYGTPQFNDVYQRASRAENLSHHGVRIMQAVEALWMPDIIKLQGQIAAAEREESNRRRLEMFREAEQRMSGGLFNKVFQDEIPDSNWEAIAKMFEPEKQQQQLPEPKPPAKKGFPWFFGKRRW
ncbi:hypothetical protein Axy04_035 [Achromobacter phage vB_AxyP_19-32_Axy04]|uniref:Uncharacterized protein n=1 Tax=Achromobacter phage vB_AxyP_19-32_Axy04 TaxID=2591039 RepID=A0A514CTF6_9CAUD|nr:hypothetical protein KMC55_gp79 [Achromobacter phage vB_AxyP_19-32_Axy04]QDH83765.1 hypothetical protein Axy04_035 [Achromobacter phage vB_AxyP_19-32_Axy04]